LTVRTHSSHVVHFFDGKSDRISTAIIATPFC
jgi:hypothetical protein